MNLNQLKCFQALAKNQHYTRTAEELSIAQSSLSRMITQLETELSAPLFEKRGRNVILTKQGELFLSYIDRGLNEIALGTSALHEMMNPHSGTIDFAFIYALIPTFVPKLIQEFLSISENKGFNFRFYQANSMDIIRKVKEGTCDIGFCSYVENEPLVNLTPITSQEYVLMVSKNHPLARKDSITLKEAAKYDFILPLDKTSYVETLFRKADIIPNVTSRVEEDHAAAALVSINLGIAIIPKNEILNYYDVKLIPFQKPLYRTFYMATAKDHLWTPAAEKFYQFILHSSKRQL